MSVVKGKIKLFLCVAMLLSMSTMLGFVNTQSYAASGISVKVDGKTVPFTQEPIIKDGRTLVPLRAIFEAMDMKIDWDSSTKSIKATKNNVFIKLQVGNKNASVGNDTLSYIDTVLDVEPQIINSSTLVPVRFIGEVSGSDVTWDQTTKTVVVNSKTDRSFDKKSIDTNTNYLGYLSNTSKEMDGFGKYSSSEGVYIGNHIKDKLSGQGTYVYSDGDKYVGTFKDDMHNGQGVYTFSNGDKYVGEYKDDKRNGQGTYTYADGDKYVGQFKDGEFNGQGTYTYADGTTETGTWVNGDLK